MPGQRHIPNTQQSQQPVANISMGKGNRLPAVQVNEPVQSGGIESGYQAETGADNKGENTSAGKSETTQPFSQPLQKKEAADNASGDKEMLTRFVPHNPQQPTIHHPVNTHSSPVQRKVFIKSNDPAKPDYDMPESEIDKLSQPAGINTIIRNWITGRRDHSFDDQTKMIVQANQLLHSVTYDGTLKSVAAEITKGLAGAKLLSDDVLLDILKRPFEADWFKAKACLAMGRWPSSIETPPPHDGCLDMMEALVEMRSRKWDQFYKKYLPKAKTALNDATLDIPPPDGSQSVTSDIDLSVKGAQSEAAVEYFNTMFKTDFGVAFEPGTVFDINLYSLDWMHGQNETISEKDTKGERASTIVPARENNLQNINLEGMLDRASNQEVWSYVKIMRNLSGTEIADYKTNVLKDFTKGSGAYITMSKKLDEAELNTISFKASVEEKAAEMETQFKADMLAKGLNPETSAFKTGASDHESNKHFQEEALKMRASNAIYQDTIKEVKKIRERIQIVKSGGTDADRKSIEDLAKLLANKIAEALTYANEVYASEGGVLHTVYGKQKADKKKAAYAQKEDTKDIKTVKTVLSESQYIQSVNENVGDSVHSLNHFGHIPKYAVFRAGKYLDRLCEATELLDERQAPRFPNYAILKEIGTTAAKEKNGALGADPLAANTHPLFGAYDAPGVAALKQQILVFGAAVTSHFNRT